jgi:catechol 2,3-dioxygenase-like lactoylglutathione lyase family enzyme
MEDDELLARVVLVSADGSVTVVPLVSDRPLDLSTVDRVAHMVLDAHRRRRHVRLEEACPSLVQLLDLAGMADLVGLGPAKTASDDSRDRGSSYQEKGGRAMPASVPTIQVQGILTVGVPVTDQDRALRFYVDTLGFELQRDVPIGGGKRWIVVAPVVGTATIALVAANERVPAGVETGVRLVSANVGRDHAALKADGVEVGEILRWEGVPPMFAFYDPDGNGLELVEEA